MSHYPDVMSVQEGLQLYFQENGFGTDGGYGKKTVSLTLGPITLHMPNTEARKRAVQRHDIHHLVTGYTTDLLGEAEIAAWELASGCRDYYAAWMLNLMVLPAGLFMNPGRLLTAVRQGRRSRNLYHEADIIPYLQDTIGSLRARLLTQNNNTTS